MKYKKVVTALLCAVLLLEGCGGQNGNEGAENGSAAETEGSSGNEAAADIYEEGTDKASAGNAAGTERTESEQIPARQDAEGSVTIEMGPDKAIYDTGTLICTLHDFTLYASPEEASVLPEEINDIDAEYYKDESRFLVIQADISNIDHPGEYEDGKINLSRFTIGPSKRDEEQEPYWEGSLPVYLSEAGRDGSFYHVLIKPGETRTIAIGFYVPVKDAEELRSECKILMYGTDEEGYVYDIPEVKK